MEYFIRIKHKKYLQETRKTSRRNVPIICKKTLNIALLCTLRLISKSIRNKRNQLARNRNQEKLRILLKYLSKKRPEKNPLIRAIGTRAVRIALTTTPTGQKGTRIDQRSIRYLLCKACTGQPRLMRHSDSVEGRKREQNREKRTSRNQDKSSWMES
jgi:hypothetical protein